MSANPSKSIVFITGAFLSHHCWDDWKLYFGTKGYQCIAPPWPNKEASPEELRNRAADDPIALSRLTGLKAYFESIIHQMPDNPILIGHSLGGLLVQLLLQKGLGAAGVAIHSIPPRGIPGTRFSLLRNLLEPIGLFTATTKTYMVPFRKWKNAFANGMSCDEQKELYYKYAIPESKRIIRDVFSIDAKLNFNKPHAPLLILAGGKDQMITSIMAHHNYTRYRHRSSTTHYKQFKNCNHLVFDPPSMTEEAKYIFYWLHETLQIHH